MDTFARDLRYALRLLRRSPGFTVLAIVSLALGIGVSTAAYTLVDAWLLRPLPFPDADRLVILLKSEAAHPDQPAVFAGYRDYLAWARDARSFERLSAVFWRDFTLTGGAEPEQLHGLLATQNLFETLGQTAERGRTFAPSDLHGPPVVVLGYDVWQRRYNGREDIIGTTVTLNGTPRQVIGVLRQRNGLHFLDQPFEVEVYALLQPDEPDYGPTDLGPVAAIGRLAPGVSIDAARAELTAVQESVDARFPDNPKNFTVHIASLQADNTRTMRASLLTLAAAACVMLLIVCANVASLLIGRSTVRRREMAMRLALGAGRGRVVRQMLTESALLGVAGGASGMIIAFACVRAFVAFQPLGAALPPNVIAIDARALIFALVLTMVTALVCGCAPLVALFRGDLNPLLLDAGRGASIGRGAHRLRDVLVVLEVAACVVLLVSALLLARTLSRVRAEPLGFDASQVTEIDLLLPAEIHNDTARRRAVVDSIVARLATLPAVTNAGASSSDALGGGSNASVEVEGRALPTSGVGSRIADRSGSNAAAAAEPSPIVLTRQPVTSGYLPALRIPLLAGRGFTDDDREDHEPVALLNESAARRLFAAAPASAIGHRIKLSGDPEWRRIVGIVADTRSTFYNTLGWKVNERVFVPYRQDARGGTSPVAHRHVFYARGPGALSNRAARDLVWSVDRNIPVSTVQSLDARVSDALRQPRVRSALLGLFAVAALLLAIIGLYGIVSQSVTQRTRELGIRMALGARARDLATMVIHQGLRLTTLGAALGIAGALAVTRLLSALLYGVAPSDPLTYVTVCALLTAAAIAGSYLPARRASRVDPAIVLRNE